MSNWVNGNLTGIISPGQGEPGKSLEYMWRGTELGIKREDEEEYQFVNLVPQGSGSGNNGADGREIELQVNNGYIQWRYVGEETWNNLIALSTLEGKQGPQGLPGKDGLDGVNGKDGITPNITIGTVTTLEAGQQATVVNSGTKENPIFDFGIPKGENGSDGDTPDTSDFENKINKQYEIIKAKVDKIEQEDTPVEIPIVGSTLTLTTNKRQKVNMKNNTTIALPVVDKFTEIHLFFTTTEAYTLTLPNIKWQDDINIEANKTYEFIFTYINNNWLGGCVVYNG